MRMIQRWIAAGTLAITAACSSMQIKTDADPTADFSKYKTYAWMNRVNSGSVTNYSEASLRTQTLLDRRLKVAVSQQLAFKGLRPAREGETPDLYITYASRNQNVLETNNWSTGLGFGYGSWAGYGGWGPETYIYQQGTLVIDLIDPTTKQLVWRGIARGDFDNLAMSQDKVNDAVDDMLKKYPPEKKG